MDSDPQAVIERLTFWNQQFEQLMEMVRVRRAIPKSEQTLARERLKQLKDGLRKEARQLEALGDRMTRDQRTSLLPALTGSAANITTSVNSLPSLSWFDDLARARMEITLVLRQLEKLNGR